MKTGPDALGTAENELGRAKKRKWDLTPSVPSKTRSGAQNMKTRPDVLGTDENDFGSGKRHSTPSISPRMSPGAQNIKTGPDALYRRK
jgi:hypothetical protein